MVERKSVTEGEKVTDEKKSRASIDEQQDDVGLENPELDGMKDAKLVLDTNEDIVRNILDSYDDPEESAWTFRSVFIGVGLSIFGSILAEIYYFKPQTVAVNGVFLLLVAYVLGEFMSIAIPRKGILKWINPHPFTSKEHSVAFIMASSASKSALGAEVLAVQRLWYDHSINAGLGIFIILSSQLLGYGFVGLLRKTLIYPTKV